MKGNVKFFNAGKGFGFIIGDDGKDYFVHQSALQEGVTLNDNDPVVFDVEEGDRGLKAVNVTTDTSSEGEVSEEAPEEETTEEPVEETTEEAAEETTEEAAEEPAEKPADE